MLRSIKTAVLILGLLSMICIIARGLTRLAEDAHSLFLLDVPRVWVDEDMEKLELPLANTDASPKHVPADYYYRIPVRPIYKSYPVYAPGKEPVGYMESLKQSTQITNLLLLLVSMYLRAIGKGLILRRSSWGQTITSR